MNISERLAQAATPKVETPKVNGKANGKTTPKEPDTQAVEKLIEELAAQSPDAKGYKSLKIPGLPPPVIVELSLAPGGKTLITIAPTGNFRNAFHAGSRKALETLAEVLAKVLVSPVSHLLATDDSKTSKPQAGTASTFTL